LGSSGRLLRGELLRRLEGLGTQANRLQQACRAVSDSFAAAISDPATGLTPRRVNVSRSETENEEKDEGGGGK
jgi:hypothetical protein